MDSFTDFARAELLSAQTPIEPLARLSETLGVDLYVKRDDLAGLPFGGNKSRQLEYYLGAALAQRADTILITGAVQSNFVRTAASAAARLGLQTVVQLETRVSGMDAVYETSGNVLLSQIMGAEFMYYPEGEDEAGADAALRARADALKNEGRRPYVIPLALNIPPLGALGYVRAAHEILAQDSGFEYVVVASGSGLTHAGLLAGFKQAGSNATIIGSCVRRAKQIQSDRIATVLDNLATLAGTQLRATRNDIHIWDGALAPGYGHLGPVGTRAMQMMARSEGVMLDPVYTAKAFAAIPELVSEGTIPKGSRVLFVHTGGLAALFAYQTELQALFGNP